MHLGSVLGMVAVRRSGLDVLIVTIAVRRVNMTLSQSSVDKVEQWMELARHVSEWSKDKSTKVGCVIVGDADQVLAIGYNGFPRGVNDDVAIRHTRPLKYRWTEHAERNAIYNAARTGTNLTGSTLYVPWFPCTDCARGIIQSGIARLVAPQPDREHERWGSDFGISWLMLTEAGIPMERTDYEGYPAEG